MRNTALALRTVKGLDISGGRGFFYEPSFVDPRDALDQLSEPIEGENRKITPATKAGSGLLIWRASYTLTATLHSECYELFQHFKFCHGIVRSFWMPSWCSDFLVSRDIDPASSGRIFVEDAGFEWLFEPNRYGIMIQTVDRNLDVFKIEDYDQASGILYLGDSIDDRIDRREIMRVSLVRCVRSETKTFDWKHQTDAVATIQMNVVERPREGLFL